VIPVYFLQRHAGILAVVIAIGIIRLFMPSLTLWLSVPVAMGVSLAVWGVLYKKGVTPTRRKGSLFGSQAHETDPD